MKKKVELFVFFHIHNAKRFKKGLTSLIPMITSTSELLQVSTQPDVAINLAFSFTGLTTLGINETLNDTVFTTGQFQDAPNLNDSTAEWVEVFKGTEIHGMMLLSSDTLDLVNSKLSSVRHLFGSSMSQLYSLKGQVRPGNEEGHERGFSIVTTM